MSKMDLPQSPGSQRAAKAAARKSKKRELDRNAQRVARERTKQRIQELEALVEELKADNVNPEMSSLMTTLDQVTQQRNELQQLVRTINQAIQRHANQSSAATPGLRSRTSLGEGTVDGCVNSSSQPDVARNTLTNGDGIMEPETPTMDFCQNFPMHGFPPSENRTACAGHRRGFSEQGSNWTQSPSALPIEQLVMDTSSPVSDDVIVPQPGWPCDCVQGEPKNTWREANTALGKSTALSAAQMAVEDFTSEDTPVRVVLDGWDSVAKGGKMSVSWNKLRLIDEACFATCGDVERLGILRTMHLLLTYHGDPTQSRCDKIPQWLWTRPSQSIPHSYAIDFFVWPGLRERFIFTQHRYCTNLFWQSFRDAFRLSLPYSLSDCYSVEPDTGRYVLSPAFDSRLKDINTWRMTLDFFVQFPELCGDIPVSGSIAPVVVWTKEEKARHKMHTEMGRSTGATISDDLHAARRNSQQTPQQSLGPDDGSSCGYSLLEGPEPHGPWPSL